VLACFPGLVFATDRRGTFTLLHGQGVTAAGMGSTDGIVGRSIFDVFRNHEALLYSIRRALDGQPCTATVGFANLVMEFWCGPSQHEPRNSHPHERRPGKLQDVVEHPHERFGGALGHGLSRSSP
jgi:hypothetical protein